MAKATLDKKYYCGSSDTLFYSAKTFGAQV